MNSVPSSVPLDADVIYFMMLPGWSREMRSNRWHYASRWAQHLPVVLLQPGGGVFPPRAEEEEEPRIPNCRILRMVSTWDEQSQVLNGITQAELIRQDMRRHAYSRPIFWMYNSAYIAPFSLIPAAARIIHATENYFDYPAETVESCFVNRLRIASRLADGVICCSEGVAAGYRAAGAPHVKVVTNGCDFSFYSRGGRHEPLLAARSGFSKVAVFAGNVDERLDLGYLAQAAETSPSTLFAFFGPTQFQGGASEQWRALLNRPNVRHFGSVDVTDLPAIYASADLGIIPYAYSRLVSHNTFPLKAFEMVAAGLPLAATNLEMLKPFQASGFVVCEDGAAFSAACATLSRSALSATHAAALRAMAQAQDYDRKFEAVLALTRELTGPPKAPAGDLLGYCPAHVDEAFRGLANQASLDNLAFRSIRVLILRYMQAWTQARLVGPFRRMINARARHPRPAPKTRS